MAAASNGDASSKTGSAVGSPRKLGTAASSKTKKSSASTKVRDTAPAASAGASGPGEAVIQVCDMCDKMKEMKKRCMDCSSMMCGECAHHHTKMKITLDHDVIDIKLYNKEPPATAPRSKIFCDQHRKEKYQFYCRTCMKPLCINCKLTKHEGHRTRDLFEEIKEQREIIPMRLSQLRTGFIPVLRQQLKDTEDYEREFNHSVGATVDHIDRRDKVMKDKVDETQSKILSRLKEGEQFELGKIADRKRVLSGYVKNATTVLSNGERVAERGDDFDVMELHQTLVEMIKLLQSVVNKKTKKTLFSFKEGGVSNGSLQSAFGGISERAPYVRVPAKPRPSHYPVPVLQVVPDIIPKLRYVIKGQHTQGSKVSAIAPVGNADAWVSFGWGANEIYLYNKSGYRKKRLVLKAPVDDIAVDHSGNLFVSTFSGSVIRMVDRKLNERRDFIQIPLKTRGLTVTANGEIIACAVDTNAAMPPPMKNTMFRFTTKGNKLGTMDGDKAKRIPTHPFRVSENIDGSLCVTDLLSDREGRVVIFSQTGKVRTIYSGFKTERRSFFPYSICTDKFGHILVGDITNKEVHMLDSKGQFLRILLTSELLEAERPYSLAVDDAGQLWVGNERKQIKIYSYLSGTTQVKR